MATSTFVGRRGYSPREAMRMALADVRESGADVARPMLEWAAQVPEGDGRPLDFENFAFQREWYSDEVAKAENVVLCKSTQVGATAFSWRWGMRQADQFGRRVLYIFPTDDDVYDFSDERVEPALEDSEYLRRRMRHGGVRSKRLKRIANGFMYFRGSKSRSGAQSVPAGALVFDEYDDLDPKNLPQIERRLSGARARGEVPQVVRLGIPRTPDYGIDLEYQRSDRRVWHVTCPGCGEEQPVEWEPNVRWTMPDDERVYRPGHDAEEVPDPRVVERAWRACSECEAELEGAPIREGRWVITNPGSPTIGFHASRLIVPNTDLAAIVVASRRTSPAEVEAFESNDLGRAYSPAEAGLDRATILAACVEGGPMLQGYAGRNPVTMGVDVASERNLSVRVSEQLPDGRRRALAVFEAQDFQEVERAMTNYHVTMCVVDIRPETRLAKALRKAFLGRVVLCEYDHRYKAESMVMDVDPNAVPVKVRVNRTLAIDAMMDAVRQQRNIPPRDPPAKYVDQLRSPKRRTELDKNEEPERRYVTTGTVGDDWAHAEVYDLVATQLLGVQREVGLTRDAVRGTRLPDERIGFRRVRLDAEDDAAVSDYHAGFGE